MRGCLEECDVGGDERTMDRNRVWTAVGEKTMMMMMMMECEAITTAGGGMEEEGATSDVGCWNVGSTTMSVGMSDAAAILVSSEALFLLATTTWMTSASAERDLSWYLHSLDFFGIHQLKSTIYESTTSLHLPAEQIVCYPFVYWACEQTRSSIRQMPPESPFAYGRRGKPNFRHCLALTLDKICTLFLGSLDKAPRGSVICPAELCTESTNSPGPDRNRSSKPRVCGASGVPPSADVCVVLPSCARHRLFAAPVESYLARVRIGGSSPCPFRQLYRVEPTRLSKCPEVIVAPQVVCGLHGFVAAGFVLLFCQFLLMVILLLR